MGEPVYIHAFCLNEDLYPEQGGGEVVLGPFEAVGLVYQHIYGYGPEHPPENWQLTWDDTVGAWQLRNPIESFYSDIEFVTKTELYSSEHLQTLPRYQHARDILAARCGRTEPHGAHGDGPRWCAGNRDVIQEDA